jgi:hypothetical protein
MTPATRTTAEIAMHLRDKAHAGMDKTRQLEALGEAMLHVLGDAKDAHDPAITTAISLAGMIVDKAKVEANRFDEIALDLKRLEDLGRGEAAQAS